MLSDCLWRSCLQSIQAINQRNVMCSCFFQATKHRKDEIMFVNFIIQADELMCGWWWIFYRQFIASIKVKFWNIQVFRGLRVIFLFQKFISNCTWNKSRGFLLQIFLRMLCTQIFLPVFNFPLRDLTLQIKPVKDLPQSVEDLAQSVFSYKRTSTTMKWSLQRIEQQEYSLKIFKRCFCLHVLHIRQLGSVIV